MGLFDQKKKTGEHLHTLTEKEIREKLYGHLVTPEGEKDAEIKSATPPPGLSETSKPVMQEPATESRELFPEQERLPPSEPPIKVTRTDIFEGRKPGQDPFTAPRYTTAPNPSSEAFAKTLTQVLAALAQFIGVAFLGVLRFLGQVFDLRKPHIRKRVSWGVPALIFVSIFAGIHILNSQREIAMKAPRPASEPPAILLEGDLSPASKDTVKGNEKTSLPAGAAVKSSETATPKPAVVPAEPEEPYAIQVATFVTKGDADRLAASLGQMKLRTFVKTSKRPNSKVYHLVFIGGFKDYREAEKQLAEFKKKEMAQPFQDAFIQTFD